MTPEIIELKQREREDGKMVFTFVKNKWRNASYERKKAEDDTRRVETEQTGKDVV